MPYKFKSGSENKYLEEKYVKWEEIGVSSPDQSIMPSKLFVWGGGDSGSSGLGASTDNYSSPVQVGSLTNWARITAGQTSSYGIKNDGTLWAWGDNSQGQLGLGDITHRSSPVQVGSLTNWKEVYSNNGYCALAIKTDGTLWAWGYNYSGKLGLGDTTNRSSPVQVGSLTNWKMAAPAQNANYVVRSDGTAWVIGNSVLGQSSSPVQIGTSNDWRTFAAGGSAANQIFGIKYDGTLWGQGTNNYGTVGSLPYTTVVSSMVEIVPGKKWKEIECGQYCTFGIDENNYLWSWGYNQYGGQLGLGDKTNRTTPTMVGSLSNWKKVATSGTGIGEYVLALKTDGTLWSWGGYYDGTYNRGTLGLNDRVDRSSPTQVGTLTNWRSIDIASFQSFALQYTY